MAKATARNTRTMGMDFSCPAMAAIVGFRCGRSDAKAAIVIRQAPGQIWATIAEEVAR